MTWNELHDLSTLHDTSQHVLRHGVAAALKSDISSVKAWINATRGLSAYALCAVLDNHAIEVPAAAIAAVLPGEGDRHS